MVQFSTVLARRTICNQQKKRVADSTTVAVLKTTGATEHNSKYLTVILGEDSKGRTRQNL
jgi:hypothetical protein